MLVVSYGGTKTFRMMTYVNGEAKSHKLGTYPALSLGEARKKAKDYYANPKKLAAETAAGSFKDVAENWFKRHVEGNNLRSQSDIRRQLEQYVYPKWKNRPFTEIERSDVIALIEHIADNHNKRKNAINRGRSQADAGSATIRNIMTWQQARDDHYRSPIVRGMKLDKRKPDQRQRDRVLDNNEIRLVWKATDDMGSFGALVKLALLTGQRREKLATMQWDDIQDGVWSIPSDEREKGQCRGAHTTKGRP